MVPKVTSVRQFRLNSSLYVSGPTGRAGALRSFFLCGTMPGREGNASRRRTTTTQLLDFASPTAHTPFDAWHKPFYNRPSDCCFRLACPVALLIPITIRAFAPESVGMVNRGNSTIRQSSPPYGFVNRASAFMDTDSFNFSHFKEICMNLLPFHTYTPCEPHYSGHGEE